MPSHIWVFLREVTGHWLSWVTGSAVSLSILIKEKWFRKPVKWKAIIGIFILGLGLSLFFAWQDEYTSAEWRGDEVNRLTGASQTEAQQVQQLQYIIDEKDRPVIIQTQHDPELDAIIKQQNAELAVLRHEVPSPRKQALLLSHEILLFFTERQKAEPIFEPPTVSMTREQWASLEQLNNQNYINWMKETFAGFRERFAVPIAEIMQAGKDAKIDTSSLGLCNAASSGAGSTYEVEECGASLGALAEKFPKQ